MENLLILMVLGIIIGGASGYIYKSRKKGHKCIGCPNGCNCGSAETCCSCSKE